MYENHIKYLQNARKMNHGMTHVSQRGSERVRSGIGWCYATGKGWMCVNGWLVSTICETDPTQKSNSESLWTEPIELTWAIHTSTLPETEAPIKNDI